MSVMSDEEYIRELEEKVDSLTAENKELREKLNTCFEIIGGFIDV